MMVTLFTSVLMIAAALAVLSCPKPAENTPEKSGDSVTEAEINAYIESVSQTLGNLNEVIANLNLPSGSDGINVTWSSGNTSSLTDTGVITRPPVGQAPAVVTLTGTFSKLGVEIKRDFTVTILAVFANKDIEDDMNELQIDTYMDYFYHEIILPSAGVKGTPISWTSDNAAYPVTGNKVKIRDNVNGDFTFKLTATLTSGGSSLTKNFTVTAKEKKFYGYLFAYFTGNNPNEEQVRFGIGTDGLNFTYLNNNKPVILSSEIAATGCVRDPFILRGADGNFYMTLTDMKSDDGWGSNRGIVLLKSQDLINWTSARINIATKYPANFGNIITAWAPQVIYDRKTGRYMVYFSHARSGWTPHIIYYSYANDTFTDLVQEPKQLYNHPNGYDTIDGDIVNLNGKFHLFYKNEKSDIPNSKHIAKAVSATIDEGYVLEKDNCDGESVVVEGCQVYRLFGTDTFVLMYDRYNSNPAQFGFRKSTDLSAFTAASGSLNFAPRHGSIIPLTEEEYNRLRDYNDWPGNLAPPAVTADAPLKLHYTFGDGDSTGAIQNRAGESYIGSVKGSGGSIRTQNGTGYFYTGTNTGTSGSGTPAYIDMSSGAGSLITSQEDFTIATYVKIDSSAGLNTPGRFLWSFAASDNVGQTYPCVWFRAADTRHTISKTGWSGESSVSIGTALAKGVWVHVMYRQRGALGTIYINGTAAETGSTAIKTTELGNLTNNWIGRPCYSGDNYMSRTSYADFRIYGGAVSTSQIQGLNIASTLALLNGP